MQFSWSDILQYKDENNELGDLQSESGSGSSKNNQSVSSYGRNIALRAPKIDIA